MTAISATVLPVLRYIYRRVYEQPAQQSPACIRDPESASYSISAALDGASPTMIGRFGATELTCIANYMGVKRGARPWLGYIRGTSAPWWWNKRIIKQMNQYSGFFPTRVPAIEEFCELMMTDLTQVDVLGSWLPMENLFDQELKNCTKIYLELLNPYFSRTPWTRALKGKDVLVIHPFAKSIEAQYRKRDVLFDNNILPEFNLKTIKAVQSIGNEGKEFSSWFNALDFMKEEMDRVDYDICLIGCGAYGLPLAAHAKRQGKKGFHLGGSLQLLFGIRGARWENPDYHPLYNYSALMNEHWVRPSDEEKPSSAGLVENACYW